LKAFTASAKIHQELQKDKINIKDKVPRKD
jgi:hypothetical protein